MNIKTVLVGDEALVKKFHTMSAESQGQALDLSAQAGAEVVRDQASRNAPYRMGDLRRSLHTAKVD